MIMLTSACKTIGKLFMHREDKVKLLNEFYVENHLTLSNKMKKSLKYNKDLAHDICMDSYEKAFRSIGTYDENKGSMRVWFNKIMYNTLKQYKKMYAEVFVTDQEFEDNQDVLDEYRPHFNHHLNLVKNYKHRRILELFYKLGWSSAEIADFFDTTQTNVTTICNRFKNQLMESN